MRRSRFKSIFVKTMAGVSVICFLAITGLWVRSYWVADVVGFHKSDEVWSIVSANGTIITGRFNGRRLGSSKPVAPKLTYGKGSPELVLSFYQLIYSRGLNNRNRYVQFPHWSAVTVFGAMSFFFVHKCRRSRHAIGHCPTCNYDLRATPDRCPECGTAATLAGQRPDLSQPGASPQETMRRSF